jgi:hypothetical protein
MKRVWKPAAAGLGILLFAALALYTPVLPGLTQSVGNVDFTNRTGHIVVVDRIAMTRINRGFTGGRSCPAQIVLTASPQRGFLSVTGPSTVTVDARDDVRLNAALTGACYIGNWVYDGNWTALPPEEVYNANLEGSVAIGRAVGLSYDRFVTLFSSEYPPVEATLIGPDGPGIKTLIRGGPDMDEQSYNRSGPAPLIADIVP